MKITRIYFSGKENGNFLTYVHAEFDAAFAIHDMKLVRDHDGNMLLIMPGYVIGDRQRDLFHPVNKDTRGFLEKAVFGAYENRFSSKRSE